MDEGAHISADEFDDDDTMKTVVMSGAFTVPQHLKSVHLLVEVKVGHHPKIFTLKPGANVLGRNAACEIQLQDVKVSGRHCRIDFIEGTLIATDLGSTNGSMINAKSFTVPTALKPGDALSIGSSTYLYEIRDQSDTDASHELHEDLKRASQYIEQLLPAPRVDNHLSISPCYVPCTLLGGDAFGYGKLADDSLYFYLLDVAGHGVEAALHASAVMNVLNAHTLPNVNFENPSDVLAGLNRSFHMADHAGKYFTLWYAVFNTVTRQLIYAGGGHPSVFLYGTDATKPKQLNSENPGIGLVEGFEFTQQEFEIPEGSRLLLFSDGAYECVEGEDGPWTTDEFAAELHSHPELIRSDPKHIYHHVCQASKDDSLDDDFTLLAIDFTQPG